MNFCPNFSDLGFKAKWDAITNHPELGETEARKEFLRAAANNREMRTPEEVIEANNKMFVPKSAQEQQARIDKETQQLRSLSNDPTFDNPETLMGRALLDNDPDVFSLSVLENSKTRALEILQNLVNGTNISAQFVTPEEAAFITSKAKNSYDAKANPAIKPAFFYGDTVYFIKGMVTTESVLHEFAHPLVKEIMASNPTLFQSLLRDALQAEPNLVDEAIQEYEDLREAFEKVTDLDERARLAEEYNKTVAEEIIVKALTKAAMYKERNINPSTGFKKAVTNIIAAIKQLLRKMFGSKINISKLDTNTTLDELGAMLVEGGNFKVDTQLVSKADVVNYMNTTSDYIKDIEDAIKRTGKDDMIGLMRRIYEGTTKQIELILKNKNWQTMLNIFADEYKRGDLAEMRSNISKYARDLEEKTKTLLEEIQEMQDMAIAMTTSTQRLDAMMRNMRTHVKNIKKDIGNLPEDQKGAEYKDSIGKLSYYRHFIRYWDNYIKDALDVMRKANIDPAAPIMNLLKSIDESMIQATADINDLIGTGIEEVLWEEWQPIAERMEEKTQELLKTLEDAGASDYKINKEYKAFYGLNKADYLRFKALRERVDNGETLTSDDKKFYEAAFNENLEKGKDVTKEKIALALKGSGLDIEYFNGFFEGYLYNTDPVIGGFALFYKRNMTEMQVRAQVRENEIVNDLAKLVKDAGITFTQIGAYGEKIGFRDKIAYFNRETKQIEEKFVWTLLNKWKDYRYDYDKFDYEIDQLRREYLHDRSKENKLALDTKIADKKKFLQDRFVQDYTDEYYNRDNAILSTPLGVAAYNEKQRIQTRIRALKSRLGETYESDELMEQLKLEKRNLSELYSLVKYDGTPKQGDERKMAELLIAHREATSKFYESIPKRGVFENAYKNAETKNYEYLKKSRPDLVVGSYEFQSELDRLMDIWVDDNTYKAIRPEYYEYKAERYARLAELTALPLKRLQTRIAAYKSRASLTPGEAEDLRELQVYENQLKQKMQDLDFSESFKVINNLVSGYKDEEGEPNATEMQEGAIKRIKDAHEEIEKIKQLWHKSGLTADEANERYRLNRIKKAGKLTDQNDIERLKSLNKKAAILGLTEAEAGEMSDIFAELRDLDSKLATTYYLDTINKWLNIINSEELYQAFGFNEATQANIQRFYNYSVLQKAFVASPEFKAWFKKNHYVTKQFESTGGKPKMVEVVKRISAWNIPVVNDDKFYEKTEVTRIDGTTKLINGKPNFRYFNSVIKRQYMTGYDPLTGKVKKIVGVHIDNQGNPLPKDRPDSPYINHAYNELRDKDPNLFKLLEGLTFHHLKNQEGLSARNKLYLDFPRYEMSTLEKLQKTGLIKRKGKTPDLFTRLINNIKDFFYGARAGGDPSSLNYSDERNLVRAAFYDDTVENIPIQGLYNLRIDDTSTDFITNMLRYMYSAEHQKQLIKMHPTATSLKAVLEDPNNKIKDPKSIQEFQFVNFGVTTNLNKKGKYVRKDAFNNFYNRFFLGETTTGYGANTPFIRNMERFLMGGASTAFFAFNIPSALKNSLGLKFQAMIMAASGNNITFSTLARGEVFAMDYMTKLSFGEAYRQGSGSLVNQLVQVFDPIQDRLEDKFGTQFTRTLLKDVTSKGILFNFRKWVEIQAGIQVFGGMMYKQQVKMGDKYIDYMDAWELNSDGKIQLKEGVDPEWGITYDEDGKPIVGKKFNEFRNRVHMVMNKLSGAYSRQDQPEMSRYIAFRFVSFLRRYFTAMAVQRFGKRRRNPGYGDIDEGYWTASVRSLIDLMRTRNINDLTPDDKKAMMQAITEVAAISFMGLLIGFLFGWDDEDEERYEKIRQRSGALPIPGVAEDFDREFNLPGFMGLHLQNLMMQVKAENEQFIPWPGYGLGNVRTVLDLKSIAFGPTIDTYGKILQNVAYWADDSDKQFYKRRVGPYEWQDQGGRKLWASIAKMLSLTGSNIDPGQTIISSDKAKRMSTYR
jgi:hypothetical protein